MQIFTVFWMHFRFITLVLDETYAQASKKFHLNYLLEFTGTVDLNIFIFCIILIHIMLLSLYTHHYLLPIYISCGKHPVVPGNMAEQRGILSLLGKQRENPDWNDCMNNLFISFKFVDTQLLISNEWTPIPDRQRQRFVILSKGTDTHTQV